MEDKLAYSTRFDRTFYSYELGLAKPDVRYFNAIVAQLGLAPEQVIFIDDGERNVAAAREAGLHAEQFVLVRDGESVATVIKLLERYAVL